MATGPARNSRRSGPVALAPRVRRRYYPIAMPSRLLLLVACLVLAAPSSATAADFALVGLTDDGVLVRFDSATPASVQRLPIRGARGSLVGLDRRPQNDRIYAVGTTSDLYELDVTTGTATTVATLTTPFDGGLVSGFDFNPQADRLRLIGANGQNLRIHADLGATATDAPLAYARGDRHFGARPTIAAAAYTNAVAGTPTTKLFDIDGALDVLVLQDPPNDGALVTVGALGVEFDPESGFDIFTDERGVDHGLAASRSTLYAIDLATGRAAPLGTIGDGSVRLIGLTILGPVGRVPSAPTPGREP